VRRGPDLRNPQACSSFDQARNEESPVTHDDPFMPALAFFSLVALASFAAGWFSQALFGAF